MKVQEIIDLVNNKHLYSLNDVKNVIGNKAKQVTRQRTNVGNCMPYSTAIDIYKCDNGFVGVWGISQLFSKEETLEDMGVVCQASEYIKEVTVRYWPK